MVVGMNVRDDCLPLAKELKVAVQARATGRTCGRGQLSEQQRR
jgi:hypothetical protein